MLVLNGDCTSTQPCKNEMNALYVGDNNGHPGLNSYDGLACLPG